MTVCVYLHVLLHGFSSIFLAENILQNYNHCILIKVINFYMGYIKKIVKNIMKLQISLLDAFVDRDLKNVIQIQT